MDPVTVARYESGGLQPRNPDGSPAGAAWLGLVETRNWIVWEDSDGTLWVSNGRETEGDEVGAVRGAMVIVERQTGAYGLPGVRVHADGSFSPIPTE